MTAEVDVVIVNWNAGGLLRECVDSLEHYGGCYVSRIIVVDNGSSDGSESAVADFPRVQLHRSRENLGFAKACNLGASFGVSPYILFLNPDAKIMVGTLERALLFMESEEAHDVGICGIRLIGVDGKVQRHCARFPSWRTYFGNVTGLNVIFPARFPPHFMTDFDHLSSRYVDEVIGAFFLVRRSLFDELGGFDERFFVYFEELDFALRARLRDSKTFYLSDAVAFHKGGGTTDRVRATRLFYSLRSRILYSFKNFSMWSAILVAVLTLFVEPLARLARAALKLRRDELMNTAKGTLMLWRDLPAILRTALRRG